MNIRILAILKHLFGSSTSSSGDDSHGKFNLITLLAFTFTVEFPISLLVNIRISKCDFGKFLREENIIELVLKTCLEKRPVY